VRSVTRCRGSIAVYAYCRARFVAMEDTMTHRHLPYHLTAEDRLTCAKWARGVAIVYGSVLLLIIGAIGAQHMSAASTTEAAVANGTTKVASHVVRTSNIAPRH